MILNSFIRLSTMEFNWFSWQCIFLVSVYISVTNGAVQPNIVLIIADDMGWNDVGFHGSNQIPTPNIDALAYNGVILNSHYVLPVCTPSRAALMTGKYPIHMGMQGHPISAMEPRSLPPGKILPQYLKDIGYRTHLIGKWHLGRFRQTDTPTFRGFDHHVGYHNGYISYYDFISESLVNETSYSGYDMWRNTNVALEDAGQYATDFFTKEAVNVINNHDAANPLFLMVSHLAGHAGNTGKNVEAPQERVNEFKYIINSQRRTYAAMISKMDDSVGEVVAALQARNMLHNSIILFMSDNGAPTIGDHANWGSNYPLRGIKETLWEGAIRSPTFIWSPLLHDTPRVSYDLFHMSDWLPTLYTAAGGDLNSLDPEIDGIDQWSSLAYNFPSPRSEVLLNFEEKYRNAALRFNNWKLVIGYIPEHPEFNSYYGESGSVNIYNVPYNTTKIASSLAARALQRIQTLQTSELEYERLRDQATIKCQSDRNPENPGNCYPEKNGEVCLYDITSDPCEEHNLANLFPYVVRRMKRALVQYRAGLVPQINQPDDISAAPVHFKYTWAPWGFDGFEPPKDSCTADNCTT